MEFADFHARTRDLAAAISADGFTPDLIVGVARGGWIPARLLAGFLGTKRLASFGATYADAERTHLVAYQAVEPPPAGSRVLVVEDFLESGKSLAFVATELTKNGADVRTACIGHMSGGVMRPTYSLGQINKPPALPWD